MSDEQNVEFRDASADLQGDIEKMRRERARKQRSAQFDAKLKELANKAVDFRLKYGENNYLTELMMTFLEVATQLKEVVEVLSAVNVAMECLSDAIGFIDAAISFDEKLFDDSLQQKYGVLARWKRRRKARKAIRNNVGRVQAIVEGITMKYQMAIEVMGSLKTACVKMQKCMKKKSLAGKKDKASKGESFGKPTAANDLINEVLRERGLSESELGSVPSEPASAKGEGGVSDIDDIV